MNDEAFFTAKYNISKVITYVHYHQNDLLKYSTNPYIIQHKGTIHVQQPKCQLVRYPVLNIYKSLHAHTYNQH